MFADYLRERGITDQPGVASPPWVVAHRGYSGVAPENTLAAVDAARATGVDFIEVDLWVSGDGTPVVIHDGSLGRTTGATGNVGNLSDERISLADAGSWLGRGYAGQRVPTFDGLLHDIRSGGGSLFVELKGNWSAGAVASVSQSIMDFGLADRIVVQSFSVPTLKVARDVMPMVPRGLLVDSRRPNRIDLADELELIAINPSVRAFQNHRGTIDNYLAAGLACCVYTANKPEEWAQLLAGGVTAIITDHPARLQGFMAARELAA